MQIACPRGIALPAARQSRQVFRADVISTCQVDQKLFGQAHFGPCAGNIFLLCEMPCYAVCGHPCFAQHLLVWANSRHRSNRSICSAREVRSDKDGPFLPFINRSGCCGRSPLCGHSLQARTQGFVELTHPGTFLPFAANALCALRLRKLPQAGRGAGIHCMCKVTL